MENKEQKIDTMDVEEILEREVTSYGNSCHIPVPSKHKGKMARVTILAGHHPCEECSKPIYNKYEDFCEECLKNYKEIINNKGSQILGEILEKALENPETDVESKKVYEKYLNLLDEGKLYDHFINFIYSWNKSEKKKGGIRDDDRILELVRNGKLDELKEGAKK